MYLVTFQKRNGEVFKRVRKTMLDYRVGEETSMGWKVLDVKYRYKGKWYTCYEYEKLITKAYNKAKKQNESKKNMSFIYKHLIQSLSLLILVRVFELTFNTML